MADFSRHQRRMLDRFFPDDCLLLTAKQICHPTLLPLEKEGRRWSGKQGKEGKVVKNEGVEEEGWEEESRKRTRRKRGGGFSIGAEVAKRREDQWKLIAVK